MMESKFEIKKEKKQINEEKELLNDKALCLVEFSNACLRKTLSSVNFEMYKGNTVNQKCRRILVASTDHLMYSGTNYDRSMFQVTSSVLKIAVLNKRTQRFKLYDVDYFVLKPILKCDIFADTFLKSKIEQNQSLTLEFGGKTKKRSLVSKLKFQSGENNMTLDESVLQKISEMPSTSLDIKPTVLSTSDDIIPPVNKTALSPAEVYSIIDIIPEDLYSALESEIGKFKDITYETLQAWKKESKFSDIIIHYLETNYHSLSIENTKLLYYIQFLIIFVNVKYTDLRKKDPLPEIPQPYRQGMMKRYLLNRSFPQRMKDKLVADLIILCLHLNHFNVDGTLLALSTKISIKRLINIAYALGCYVHSVKGNTNKRFELKLPLYKYEPIRMKRK